MKTNNHPANGPVSLDRLHQISEILSKASAQSDGGNLGYAMADAVKVIDGAIAARKVEAIYQVMYGEYWRDITEEQYHDHAIHESPIRIVYTAPPAPVDFPDVTIHQGEAISVFKALKGELVSQHVKNTELGAIGATNVQVWTSIIGGTLHYETSNGGCSLIIKPCRAAMLQAGNDSTNGKPLTSGYIAANSPVTPDGWALVPKRLTAENGAKSVLSGEFSETKFINCPECFGDDECETCDGSGRIEITVPVTWTTIKAIWAKGVEHFEAAPQQEVK